MTTLEDVLSRALLVPDRALPSDTVSNDPVPDDHPVPAATGATPRTTAAEDLRALCETLVRHTPSTTVATFVTDQVPDPQSALVLACVLQMADTDDGARFWWQYAAGAGQPAAAYCLYLHHLALGEIHVARWWHTQIDTFDSDIAPPDGAPAATHLQHGDHTSTSTLLRLLRRLARHVARPRTAVVTELMSYMPLAVAVGYIRQPDSELPLPGPDFAGRVRTLLAEAAERPDSLNEPLPARSHETTPAELHVHHHIDEAANH
ncbi:hypothetical protein [Streptomyces sp. NPDC057702]|uniref:hypothetical protein n=1 Tax=Streptomyces sp. NPDC057702 TaxID=3346221 RepID=UPI003681A696